MANTARRRRENFGDLHCVFLRFYAFFAPQRRLKTALDQENRSNLQGKSLKCKLRLKKSQRLKKSGDTPHPGGVRVKGRLPVYTAKR